MTDRGQSCGEADYRVTEPGVPHKRCKESSRAQAARTVESATRPRLAVSGTAVALPGVI